MSKQDLITITEATERFDLPRIKIHRWIKSGRLLAFSNPRDERTKLVRPADIEALLIPEPVMIGDDAEGKSAA